MNRSTAPSARALWPITAALTSTALLAACSTTTSSSTEAPAASGRTVETVLGPVTVPAQIDSVVVIEGRRDLDIALALEREADDRGDRAQLVEDLLDVV